MSEKDKKKLMYISGEDFYFFTYSTLLLLDCLGCKKGTFFKDYRKIAFLIDFVNDHKLVYIVESSENVERLNELDREYLFRSYTNGLSRRSEVLKLLFTLNKKGFVELEKGSIESVVNVSLNKKNVPAKFFDKTVFKTEYENIKKIKTVIKRLSILKLSTMLERVYKNQGIDTWAV